MIPKLEEIHGMNPKLVDRRINSARFWGIELKPTNTVNRKSEVRKSTCTLQLDYRASVMANNQTGQIVFKWNAKDLNVQTNAILKVIQPLVIQVTTLMNTKQQKIKGRKGKSKKAHVLVAAVDKATENFIETGVVIANENPEIKGQMLGAVDEVRIAGEEMSKASTEFADDPCVSTKRVKMGKAAQNLLYAVTKLLILADMVDVQLLLKSLKVVKDGVDKVANSSNQKKLLENMKDFDQYTNDLINQAGLRQNELRDPRSRDDLAAARAVLKKHSTMLLTASKVFVNHPGLAEAKANRDYVVKQVCEAVNTINDVTQGNKGATATHCYEGPGKLAQAFSDLDRTMDSEPLASQQAVKGPTLEECLESIINGASLIADSPYTRDDRRDGIYAECNAVRKALQDLLSECMTNMGGKINNKELEKEISQEIKGKMQKKTRELKRKLQKTVVDHVSDIFLDTTTPLDDLIVAARSGNKKLVEDSAHSFSDHAQTLVKIATHAATLSNNEEGVKTVRYSAAQVETLCPQVVNAARILASLKSQEAEENMNVFKEAWEGQVRTLMRAVDSITDVNEFMAVSENHILEDINNCSTAIQEGDVEYLSRNASAITGRSERVANVALTQVRNCQPGEYTAKIVEAVHVLRNEVMPNFSEMVDVAIKSMTCNPPKIVDQNKFLYGSYLVYDGVKRVTRAVDANKDHEDDSDLKENTTKIEEEEEDTATSEMRSSLSDLILLAKDMYKIMTDMTGFTSDEGPLETSMDVINAAKKISEAGTKFNKLATRIAEKCPESAMKKDMLAYMQQIPLYCHQLNITSKVKEGVQSASGGTTKELDSVTSLVQTAKNLTNAVFQTVKSSYVASTKYNRRTNTKNQ
uniref:Catenin alpha n=2 Tax=Lygus hesperus TaxID=30085 RepID=A0A0A9YR99_LYGHE